MLTSVEICAGGGGQALGLEQAGFAHVALVEIEPVACQTLRANRPGWNVIQSDLRTFDGRHYNGVDLFAGGVPCPPFSVAGKQLGESDDRNLFPEALRLIQEIRPRAVMLENVRGLLTDRFSDYRAMINGRLASLGYEPEWKLLTASDYGVPQLRPRAVLIALREDDRGRFEWPLRRPALTPTVGEALLNEMGSRGWRLATSWAEFASRIGPTLVGGSHKHGGPDLGPTRARQDWAELGVDGKGVVQDPPGPDFQGMPRLTVKMAAILQGFPVDWNFCGTRTQAYRQVGNAFPPPVARAVGERLVAAIRSSAPNSARRVGKRSGKYNEPRQLALA
jgi:DNA (cytosine-5)-methyltransferase 1